MKKTILIILSLSILLNVGWVAFVLHNLATTQVKTTATVSAVSTCPFNGPSSHGRSLNNQCPTFTYVDSQGKSHVVQSTDGFNSLNKFLLGVKVGDKRAAWYEKSDPGASYIAYGLPMLSVWVLPLIIGLVVSFLVWGIHFTRSRKTNGSLSRTNKI